MNRANNPYESIIKHEHHVSKKHPRMSMEKRAAQFMPFKALTGYEEEIEMKTGEIALNKDK